MCESGGLLVGLLARVVPCRMCALSGPEVLGCSEVQHARRPHGRLHLLRESERVAREAIVLFLGVVPSPVPKPSSSTRNLDFPRPTSRPSTPSSSSPPSPPLRFPLFLLLAASLPWPRGSPRKPSSFPLSALLVPHCPRAPFSPFSPVTSVLVFLVCSALPFRPFDSSTYDPTRASRLPLPFIPEHLPARAALSARAVDVVIAGPRESVVPAASLASPGLHSASSRSTCPPSISSISRPLLVIRGPPLLGLLPRRSCRLDGSVTVTVTRSPKRAIVRAPGRRRPWIPANPNPDNRYLTIPHRGCLRNRLRNTALGTCKPPLGVLRLQKLPCLPSGDALPKPELEG